ncbi:related to cis-prenyltransferase [Ramularia collo-cygni]|uniref:Alkyl transferase n=1 Tax=Ramularia collo-cygni TaxID=112498 RepID=A0A2D3VK32_9PEZI|nr:related to cis-prenyltransferase [Ramularia collo-cygni]CZT24821.1 related to cis-prenyltransferase [Ramularia collo-cygni]
MSSHAHGTHLRNWALSLPPVSFLLQHLRQTLISTLRCGPIPQHIAFVMDGNRRWARSYGVETIEGHNMGFEALARILEVCYKSGVKVVTIYAFSIENFKRSRYEVDALMDMAKTKLVQLSEHGALLERYGARVQILGDQSLMREDVRREMQRAVEMSSGNEGAVLNVCFPYTGREEITRSVRETAREWSEPEREIEGKSGRPGVGKRAFSETHIKRNIRAMPVVKEAVEEEEEEEEEESVLSDSDDDEDTASRQEPVSSHTSHSTSPNMLPTKPARTERQAERLPDPESITADTLTKNTYTSDAPPLDLLIRTSGVQRLSDFMLWQCHEDTEIVFLETLWPEFDLWHFLPVLLEWQWRQKKNGGYSGIESGKAKRV